MSVDLARLSKLVDCLISGEQVELSFEDQFTLFERFINYLCPTLIVDSEMILPGDEEGWTEEEWDVLEKLDLTYLIKGEYEPLMIDEGTVTDCIFEWIEKYPTQIRMCIER